MKKIPNTIKKYQITESSFEFYGISAVLCMLMMQIAVLTVGIGEVNEIGYAINIALYLLRATLIVVITKRVGLSARIGLSLTYFYSVFSTFLIQARSTCFIPQDIYNITTALSVAGDYRFILNKNFHVITAIYIGTMVLSYKYLDNIKLKIGKGCQMAGGLCVMVLFAAIVALTHSSEVSLRVTQDDCYTSVCNGYGVHMICMAFLMANDEPEGYDAKEAETYIEKYANDYTPESTKSGQPNVIVIMNESFSDLSVLGDIGTDQSVMPFMESLNDDPNAQTGYTKVHIKGGNTTQSEFAYLSGYYDERGMSSPTPYLYVKDGKIKADTLVQNFAQSGYKTYGMHQYYPTGYYRDRAYERMGFSETIFMDDIPFEDDDIINEKSQIQDDACGYRKILDLLKESEDPVFVFDVTMQNHGGYQKGFINMNPVETTYENEELSNYLGLIKKSDEALKDLIAALEECNEDTMVVFFGDHQPADSVVEDIVKNSGTTQMDESRFIVPFAVWTNYGENLECFNSKEPIPVQYLGMLTLEALGMPMDEWQGVLHNLYAAGINSETEHIHEVMQYRHFKDNVEEIF